MIMQEEGSGQSELKELVALRSRLIDHMNQSSKLLQEIQDHISRFTQNYPTTQIPPMHIKNDLGKIRTGITKLDQLLEGGYPSPSNINLSGPPFSSKELFAYSFLLESISDNYPTIIVTIDREPSEIEASIADRNLIQAHQKSGILKVVDAYSRFVQSETPDPAAIVIDGTSNISNFLKSIDTICAATLKDLGPYRMAVFSLTGLLTQTEERTFIKALQHFSQRRKAEGAVVLYLFEAGLFDRRIYENVNYFMDATIDFRVDDNGEYLRVRGLSGIRTREWVEVIRAGGSIDLGSFDLRRVR